MRQYCPWPRIIAKRFGAAIAAAFLLTAIAGGQEAQPYIQYRQASAEAFAQKAKPPVEISATTIEDNTLHADIRVQPWITDNLLAFTMAVPPGEITSASLYVEQLYDSDSNESGTEGGTTTASLNYQREVPITAKHLAWIRGNRIVKLNLPSIVPGTFGKHLKTGRLTLSYAEHLDVLPNDTEGEKRNGSVDKMLAELVANPANLHRFAVPLKDVPIPAANSPVPLGGYADAIARFTTKEEGFVSFTGFDLASAGAKLDKIALTSVTVWTNDQQVAVYSDDHWDEPFRPVQPDDTFILYARDQDSTYTANRTHWIRIGADVENPIDGLMQFTIQPPARVSPGNQIPRYFMAESTVEEDVPPVLTKNDQFLTILGYRWVWFTWTPSGNGSAVPNPRDFRSTGSVNFDLDGLATGTAEARLNLEFYSHLWPKEARPVRFSATLNGSLIGQFDVAEPASLQHSLSATASLLRSTGNTLVLTPETSASAANLPELAFDKLTVQYPRSYNMTSSTLEFYPPAPDGGPVELSFNLAGTTSTLVADVSDSTPVIIGSKGRSTTGTRVIQTKGPADRRYVAVDTHSIPQVRLTPFPRNVDLRSTTNTADLVIIAWPEFIADMEPWVSAMRSKGHTVAVVDVHDIYNQFGYGHLSPHAIREFIRYATLYWQGSQLGPAANAILLVGDSTSAYRNEFRNDVINYVPTMRITDTTDPYASDQWFVNIFGDDHFADALIGRFSVNNRNDLQNLVSKQLDYVKKPTPGAWQNTLGFIADHSEFEESVDRVMRRAVPPRFFMDSIRMDDLPWIDNYYFPKDIADTREAKVSPVATRRILDMFNNGASVVTYFGHGSPNIWSNERMWFGGDSPNSDNLLLTNRDRLPVVINMTCNSGAIDYPQPRWNICISEDFMRVKNGGAVACFVPSGPGLTVQHERLMMEIGRTLFGPEEQTLGHSMQLALWRYLASGNPAELARMYILLGDPLLVPHVARPVPVDATASVSAPDWPGTVPLPGDIAAQKSGGSYQFTSYGDAVEPGSISTFTSTTLALPLSGADTSVARALAVSTSQAETTNTLSTIAPLDNPGAVKLVQWRRIDKPTISTTTATLQLRLRNDAPVPVLDLHAVALVEDSRQNKSVAFGLAPFEEKSINVEVPVKPGLNPLQIALAHSDKQQTLDSATLPAIAGLRPDAMRDTVAPAVIDPRSIAVKYRESGTDIIASITCQIYITAAEPLSNLRIGIEGPDGAVIQPSIVTVPPVSPGDGTRVTLSASIPADTTAAEYKIRFDPSAFYPEFARFPAQTVTLGSTQFPDPQILSVTPSEEAPTNGETVFFNVLVKNAGSTPVEGIKVQGFRLPEDQAASISKPVPLESKVTGRTPMLSLDPGEAKTLRLRWDPFQNPGNNRLQFTATSIYNMPDANQENNNSRFDLYVRTKASIRFVKVGVLPLTAEDQAARQLRFVARLTNEGETDATGLQIQFHSNKPRTPHNLLGEAALDSLKAGETKDVTLTYKLKPGEEHKPFQLSCEAHYKGSRQRISVD